MKQIEQIMEGFNEITQQHWHRAAGEFISASDYIYAVKDFIKSSLKQAYNAGLEDAKGVAPSTDTRCSGCSGAFFCECSERQSTKDIYKEEFINNINQLTLHD